MELAFCVCSRWLSHPCKVVFSTYDARVLQVHREGSQEGKEGHKLTGTNQLELKPHGKG